MADDISVIVGTEATGNTDALTVNIPGSAVAGDFLVLYQVWNRPAAEEPVTPSGWTTYGVIVQDVTVGLQVFQRQHDGVATTVIAGLSAAAQQRGIVLAFTDGVPGRFQQGSFLSNGTAAALQLFDVEVPAQDASFGSYGEVLPTTLQCVVDTTSISSGNEQVIFASSATAPRYRITRGPIARASSLTSVPGFTATLGAWVDSSYYRAFVSHKVKHAILVGGM